MFLIDCSRPCWFLVLFCSMANNMWCWKLAGLHLALGLLHWVMVLTWFCISHCSLVVDWLQVYVVQHSLNMVCIRSCWLWLGLCFASGMRFVSIASWRWSCTDSDFGLAMVLHFVAATCLDADWSIAANSIRFYTVAELTFSWGKVNKIGKSILDNQSQKSRRK